MRKRSRLSFFRKGTGSSCSLLSAILLFFSLLLAGNAALAQDSQTNTLLSRKVSYKTEKTSLSRVLKDLRKQLHLRITYNDEHIREQPPVTVNLQSVTLETLLNAVLKETDLTYTMAVGGVIISKKINAAQPASMENAGGTIVFSGQIVSPAKKPLEGVSIQAMESGQKTMTSPDGIFVLNPRPGEMVQFTLMGMKKLLITTKKTDDNQFVRLQMDTIVQAIQEVVVNGYQRIDPRLATGSVKKLSGAEVVQPGVASIDKMLQGKVPGLMVLNTSGGVNAAPTLRIRGTATLMGNAAPLWVIDGMIRPEPVDVSSAILNNILSNTAQSNFQLMGNAISGVNPHDIESITFLRDAAATAIYGTRAANGVIVVTTKRGKEGPVRLAYDTDFSFQQRPNYRRMNLMNSQERVQLSRQLQEDHVKFVNAASGYRESFSYEGLLQELYARNIDEAEFARRVAILETRNTDWLSLLFRNQFSMSHALALHGGNAKTTYRASVRYADSKGAAKEDGLKNYTASLSLNSKVSDRISLDFSMLGSYRESKGYNGVDPLAYALQTNRAFSPDDFIPKSTALSDYASNELAIVPPPITYNVRNEIAHSGNTGTVRSMSANLQINYRIAKGLFFRNMSSFISDGSDGLVYSDQYSYRIAMIRGWDLSWTPSQLARDVSPLPVGGMAEMNAFNNTSYNFRNSIEYTKGLFRNRDQFSFTFGNEIMSTRGKATMHAMPGYFPERGNIFSPTPEGLKWLSTNSLTLRKDNTMGLYTTAAYNLKNRYILSGSIRTDASNRFGKYANSNFRPNFGISGRWNATMENWFPRTGILSDWQLRASYGTQGNVVSAVGPDLIARFHPTKKDPVSNMPYLSIKSLPYPDLRWEKTYQFNIGTNIGLFDNRLTLNLDYYEKQTRDVIDMLPVPFEYGVPFMYRNGSRIFNNGLEVDLTAHLIRNKNTSFTLNWNFSKNLNRLAEQVGNFGYESLFNGQGNLPGRAISGFYSYMFKGLNPENGVPMFHNIDREKMTSDPDDLFVYAGQLHPKLTMNFAPTLTYKAFSFSTNIFVSLGSVKRLDPVFGTTHQDNGVPSPLSNASRNLLDRWRKPGDERYTNIPVAKEYTGVGDKLKIPYNTGVISNGAQLQRIEVSPIYAYNLSDLRTVKNDYLRCNNMNLRYAVPERMLTGTGIRALSVGLSVNNVFTIANPELKGQDPEISNVGTSALPLTRQFAGSLNVAF